MDNPNPEPAAEPAPELGADMGGDVAPEANDKPFDDTPFEAGVEADEESNPKEYIQQLSGKLGQSLRKYEKDLGTPDLELEKFAINSVISASNTAEMDAEDQKDIIDKVKTSGLDNDVAPDAAAEPAPEPDAAAEPAPAPEAEVDVEAPELGEEMLPEEDKEYDAMKAYHDKKNGTISENLRAALMETFPKLPKEMTENLKYPTRDVRSERGYLGATIWGDSGQISLNLYSHQNNPYGGSPWKQIQSGGGMKPEEFNKDYIMKNVAERFQKPENFAAEIDELLNKVGTNYDKFMQDMNPEIAEPEVQPKREVEQPKRIKERDLPFRKPMRETKTKPKAHG